MGKKKISLLLTFLMLLTAFAQTATAEEPADAASLAGIQAVRENLALHKPAYSSGNEVDWLVPENAVDGNSSTRWSSAKDDNQWFYVDLGEVKDVNQVVIKWQTPASTYKLLVSNDAAEWTNVLKNDAAITCKGGTETIDFDRTQARYVKFQGIARAPVGGIYYGYSFFEFEAYNAGDAAQIARGITSIPAIAPGQTEIVMPAVPEGYKVTVYGSDRLPVIDKAGVIHEPLVDSQVNLLLQVESLTMPDEKAVTGNVPVTVPGQYVQTGELNKEPGVIPSLREWHGRTDQLTLTNSSQIVVNPSDQADLQKTAEALQSDLAEVSGWHLDIQYGSPGAGDIYLAIDDSLASLGKEGYILDTDDYVTLKSATAAGVFYGTRSVLQILKQDEGNDQIPKGTARDYPKYEIRGVMLDVARKFYTIDFLRDYVKLLSWYKMNQFQIHLNDDVGTPFQDGTYAAFRLENETYPGLASGNGHYTKEEFRDLQLLGMDYGVNVIPEIDTPGHSRSFVDYNPSLGSGGHLDITKPETVQFVKSLFDEYIDGDNPTFVGPDVHIGTDEYWGDTETFRGYMDTLVRYINAKGKHPHLWGGLLEYNGVTPISNDATMNIWHEPYGNAQQAVDLGYDIINTENNYLYLVPRLYREYLDTRLMYNAWEPNIWTSTTLPSGHPKLKGGMLALWNDISDSVGVSMQDSHDRMFPAVQVLAEKMWTGTRTDRNYVDYTERAAVIGEAPGANISHRVKVRNESGNVVKYQFENGFADSSGNGYNGIATNVTITEGKFGSGARLEGGASYIQTPLESIGFGWTMSMWVNPDSDNPDDAVLMESPAGQLKLKQGSTGKLGFTKEHYNSVFNYTVPSGKWTHLLLIGDNKGVSLYVNGNEYVEKLAVVYDATRQLHTMVLPLARIGSATNSFKGVIDNVIVYNAATKVMEGENLALNKQAQSSDSEAPHLTPNQAVDGNLVTRWASTLTDDAWFTVDLGASKEISKVVIHWEYAYSEAYKILVSNDGEQWMNVLTNDGIVNGQGGVEPISFDPTNARYVKFQGIKRGTWYGNSFFEFEVYAPERIGGYVAKVREAEDLLALGKGDEGIREQLIEQLNEFPYMTDSTINTLEKLIAALRDSIEQETDRTPPVTTADLAPAAPNGQNGWYTEPVTVTLSAQDDQSGVELTELSLDGGASWQPYTDPIVLADDRITKLLYRSKDRAGNVEAEKSVEVKLDRTAPTFTAAVNGTPLADGHILEDNELLNFTLQDEDNLSGIAEQSIEADGKPYAAGTQLDWAGQLGVHMITVTVKDEAGNVSQTVIHVTVQTSIAAMKQLVDRYLASGDLNSSMKDKLWQRLEKAEMHFAKGHLKQSADAMKDLVKIAGKPGNNEVISENALKALTADAKALADLWAEQTTP